MEYSSKENLKDLRPYLNGVLEFQKIKNINDLEFES